MQETPYITISVHSQALCSSLITELISQIDTPAGMDRLLFTGLNPELMDTLRQLKSRDQNELAIRLKGFLCLISTSELESSVRLLQTIRTDRELCEYFILHGAGRELVAQLWKLPMHEVTGMSRTLLAGTSEMGRPQLPPDMKLRQAIHEAWHRIQTQQPTLALRKQIYELHQLFPNLAIRTVYSVTKEFKKDDSKPCARRYGTPQTGEHRRVQ